MHYVFCYQGLHPPSVHIWGTCIKCLGLGLCELTLTHALCFLLPRIPPTFSTYMGHMYQVFGVGPMSVNSDTCILFSITKDSTNLQTKLQKHQNFEAEVEANHTRIELVRLSGMELIDLDHYAKDTIMSVLLWKFVVVLDVVVLKISCVSIHNSITDCKINFILCVYIYSTK